MAPAGALLPPRIEQLSASHAIAGFSCGVPELDEYLQKYAAQNHTRRISTAYIAVEASIAPGTASVPVLGYYTLSALSFSKDELPQKVSKGLPRYPIPAVLLGKLAVEKALQNQQLGKFLLFDSFAKVIQVSKQIGVLAFVVDAMFDGLVPWYKKFGFQEFANTPRRLFVPIETLVKGS
jgi:hypothetical protein